MSDPRFEAFPPCCQKILVELGREQRRGARNCELGHLVSLAYVEVMKKQAPKAKLASPPAH